MLAPKFHPLQKKRIELEIWYTEERKKLDASYHTKLEVIQGECTHCSEDGRSAKERTSPPFSTSYCSICHKED